jgi:hypothetical protein
MAIPTIATDLTLLHNMDSKTGLSAWGSNSLAKWGVTSDIALENALALGLAPNSTGDTGIGYHHGSNVDLTANRLYVWVKIVSASGFLQTFGSTPAGVYIRVTSDTSGWTNYNDFYVGGSDIAWCNGDWHLIVLDCNRTADRTNGTVTKSALRGFGVGFNLTATASKSDVVIVDIMRYGTYMEVTGVTSSSANHSFTAGTNTITRGSGSFTTDGFEIGDTIRIVGTVSNDGEYELATVGTTTMTTTGGITTESSVASNIDGGITMEAMFQKDGPTDDNWYGFVSKNRDGDYEINSDLRIGDQSGSSRTFFISRGETIIFADQPTGTAASHLRLKTYEDTGNTILVMGQSTGTGDSRVGFGGSTIKQDRTLFGSQCEVDLSVAIDTMECFGSQFQLINGGVNFANDGSHYLTNTNFSTCGQVDIYGVEARNLEFSGYTESTDAALLWRSGTTDIKASRFLSNTRAIEHDTAGSFTYNGLTFAANTYDIVNSISATTTDSQTTQDSALSPIYGGGTYEGAGQSITGDGNKLTSVTLKLRKVGSPTGNAVVKLYTHSGTFGTSSVPTTPLLATSKNINVANLQTSLTDEKIEFDDSEFFTLVNTTKYVIAIEYSGGGASDYIEVGYDAAGAHGGNMSTYNGATWTAVAADDLYFYVRTNADVTVGTLNGANPDGSKLVYDGTPEGVTNINVSVTIEITGVTEGARCVIQRTDTNEQLLNDLAFTSDGAGAFKASTAFPYAASVDVYVSAASSGKVVAGVADDSAVFTDETRQANDSRTGAGNTMTLIPAASPASPDAFYYGHTEKFSQMDLDVLTAGVGTYTLAWEYWSGSGWSALTGLSDGTNNYKNSGVNRVSWTEPGSWATTTVTNQPGSTALYYIRARFVSGTVTTTPVGRAVQLDVTKYVRWEDTNQITSEGLSVKATWTEDVAATF